MNAGAKSAFMIGGMVLSWSVYYTVSKILVDATGSASFSGMLLRFAALIMLTVQLYGDHGFGALLRQGRKQLITLIAIGVFGFLLDLFANLGYIGGSLSTGTALLKTDVLMVNLATVIIYRKRLYASDWLGTLVMIGGVLLVLGVDIRGIRFNPTDLFFILSAMCVTVNAFIIKNAQEKYHEDADTISYYNNLVVLLLFFCTASAGGAVSVSSLSLSPSLWALTALGGLAQTGIYFFYYRNLRRCEVWVVKLYLLLMPVVSCFIGVFFLNESLTRTKLLGIVTVLCGAALILLRGRINGKRLPKAG